MFKQTQQQRLPVARLDPTANFLANRIFCVVGKRNTGKSVVIRNIVYHLSPNIDFAILISPTESTRQEFGAFMPKTWIHSSYDPSVVQCLINVQKRSTMLGKARKVLLILDDLLYDNSLFKSEAIRQIYLNGRHLSITLIVSAQYAVAVPPLYRSNTDIVILLRDTARQNRKKLYDTFCGIFESFNVFNTVFSDLTSDYGCLVINNCSKSNDVDDATDPPVMWYRATLNLPPFSVGSRTFWQLHRKFVRPPGGGADPYGDEAAPTPTLPICGARRLDADSQVDAGDRSYRSAGRRTGRGRGGRNRRSEGGRGRDASVAASVVEWSFVK